MLDMTRMLVREVNLFSLEGALASEPIRGTMWCREPPLTHCRRDLRAERDWSQACLAEQLELSRQA
jgi:hypothetical protein